MVGTIAGKMNRIERGPMAAVDLVATARASQVAIVRARARALRALADTEEPRAHWANDAREKWRCVFIKLQNPPPPPPKWCFY